MTRCLLLLLALLTPFTAHATELPAVPDTAFAEDAYDDGDPRVEKRLLINTESARPGDTISYGVLFTMDPGWHIYWINSGQGGMETEAIFDASHGSPGPVQWPTPTVYHEAGGAIITFGYGKNVLLFSELTVPDEGLQDVDAITLQTDVDYLVCEVDCIPGRASLTRELPLSAETTPDPDVQHFFDTARQDLPISKADAHVDVHWGFSKVPVTNPDDFRIELSVIGCLDESDPDCTLLGPPPERPADALVFERLKTLRLDVARVSPHPEAFSGWFIELAARTTQDDHDPDDDHLRAVLRLTDDDGQPLNVHTETLFPWQDSPEARDLLITGANADSPDTNAPNTDTPSSPTTPQPGLLTILLLALLGGALLNLMPCVFPVLAIKVFSFVSVVHEERQSIYLHAAAYTAGIIASMMVLALAVIALQLLGTQVGWGFQFQEPLFIALVGAVLVLFAANLFGVFEVTISPGKLQNVANAPPSTRRSFAEGVLAVVLATPCSAPFLGTAVGFALASSPAVIALIFFILGLGLALPFVLLTLIPGAARILPRPGPWMNHFKHFLGFALLGTAIWLLWLIGQMEGTNALIRLLVFFLATSIAAWIFGLTQFQSTKKRLIGLLLATALLITAGFFTLHFSDPADQRSHSSAATSSDPDAPVAWIPWSDDAVQAELEAGRPVFVDFTADWCITCKVNKSSVIETDPVIDAIDEHNIAMFSADWTRRNEPIRLKLAEFGKAGVPLYLVYSPDDPDNPKVLPELLTKDLLITAFRDAAP